MIEPTQIYPCFYPCASESEFESLDTQACELLDFPNAGASDYCSPIISASGVYYFTVNPEVTSLFTEEQLDTCIPYDDIVLPTPEPIG